MLDESAVLLSFSNTRFVTNIPLDIIQQYSYGRSDHRIEEPDFAPSYHDASVTAGRLGALMKQMIWVYYVVKNLPDWIASRVAPELILTSQLQQVGRISI